MQPNRLDYVRQTGNSEREKPVLWPFGVSAALSLASIISIMLAGVADKLSPHSAESAAWLGCMLDATAIVAWAIAAIVAAKVSQVPMLVSLGTLCLCLFGPIGAAMVVLALIFPG